jgi:predicted nucleic acid-binding protein
MSSEGARPLFIDTGAFFARVKADDEHHNTANEVFEAIQAGDLAYRPIYTSRFVLSELATLTRRKIDHATAVRALNSVRESGSFNVLTADDAAFADACTEFERYDDQQISFVDHLSAVLAREHDVERVFAFDSDFRTLGFVQVPADTGVR